MRVPVEVRGVAEDGSSFTEDTHTSDAGVLGALIRLSKLVKLGAEVEVTNRFSQQTATFRIVWVGEPGESELREIGIESLEPLGDFWGVRFPPKPNP